VSPLLWSGLPLSRIGKPEFQELPHDQESIPVGKDLAKNLFFPIKPASKEVIFVQSTCEATPDLGCPGSAPRTSRRLDDDVRYMPFSCAGPVDSRSSKMLN
jgi:hypothetical protein